MARTQVKSVMTSNPEMVPPECTLAEAAQKMENIDCGVLPIGSPDHVLGMITDRDIVIRAIAKGKDVTKERVADYMTPSAYYCRKEDTLEEAADQMCKHQVNRLLVKDDQGKVCGIVTIGCMLRKDSDRQEIGRIVEFAVGRRKAA